MQVLYSYQQSQGKELSFFEKQLLNQVNKVYEQYLFLLLLLVRIAQYAEEDARERASKYIPTGDDLNANTRIASNTFILLLESDENFRQAVKSRKVFIPNEQELVRTLFRELSTSPEYAVYCSQEDRSVESERAFISVVFRQVVNRSAVLEQTLEEQDINWPVNKEVVRSMVKKTLKTYGPDSRQLSPISQNWPEDKDFIVTLLRQTAEHDAEFQGYIAAKTENWDVERIALMDTILMKMTLCELLKFPDIPVKVSINEYIEISKEFSTPKSKMFINGILDKILIDLRKTKKIIKSGRGLIE
ncbi:NusB antitermination factor [Anseongella ginsenosidimutans]|uniref:NusB antitermination factor n=2 Tax=Anseongella ginsenosidimutans TaxID=496056 RepID=A0A4R3KSN4_9SPHI|nr:NusB antitermination factor [Anseongella ginsenosidimutans]